MTKVQMNAVAQEMMAEVMTGITVYETGLVLSRCGHGQIDAKEAVVKTLRKLELITKADYEKTMEILEKARPYHY